MIVPGNLKKMFPSIASGMIDWLFPPFCQQFNVIFSETTLFTRQEATHSSFNIVIKKVILSTDSFPLQYSTCRDSSKGTISYNFKLLTCLFSFVLYLVILFSNTVFIVYYGKYFFVFTMVQALQLKCLPNTVCSHILSDYLRVHPQRSLYSMISVQHWELLWNSI